MRLRSTPRYTKQAIENMIAETHRRRGVPNPRNFGYVLLVAGAFAMFVVGVVYFCTH
jgi:hypothetical protein